MPRNHHRQRTLDPLAPLAEHKSRSRIKRPCYGRQVLVNTTKKGANNET